MLKRKLSDRFEDIDKKLPLEKFIPAVFLVFMLCILILGLITYSNIERYKDDLKWINKSNDVLEKVDEIKYKIVEIPLIRRGYTITGEKNYITKFDSLIKIIKSDIQNLKNITIDNTDQQELIVKMDSFSVWSISIIDSTISDTLLTEYSPKGYTQRQIDATNQVQENLLKLGVITNRLRSNELAILKNRTDVAEKTNSTIQLFIIITSLFSFFVIGLSLYISDKLIKNKSKAEKLLLRSYEELEYRVNKRTAELKESNKKLNDEISYRKKTEETLRESEHRFREMADSAPVLIWISDREKLFNYFNVAWTGFTGRTMEEESGSGWLDGLHPDDLEKFRELYETSFNKRTPFELEFRLRNSSGEYLWLLNKGVPRYEGKEFAGFIGSCIDINERKKNERFLKIQYDISKTLSESETLEVASANLLKNICSDIGWDFGILWLADENNEYIKPDYFWSEDENFSEEYSDLYNDSLRFSKGMDFTGTIFKEGKSMWTKDLSRDKSFRRLEVLYKKGWNSGLGIPISNGKETIAIFECFSKKHIEEKKDLIEVLESAGRQIGNFIERKRAEEKLTVSYIELEEKVKDRTNELATALSELIKESEEKESIQNKIKLFAHAVASIKDSIFIMDLKQKTIFVNDAFEMNYGYKLEEISGKAIPILSDKSIFPNLKENILSRTLKEGWKGELITRRKDGSGFYTILSTSTVRNESGDAEAYVGICQDITELKETQELVEKRNNLLILLNDVIRFTNKSFDFNEAVLYSINKVCEYTHWDIGHFFKIKNENLITSGLWNERINKIYLPFKEVSDKENFLKVRDIPGDIPEKEGGVWLDIKTQTNEKYFKRSFITKQLDLKTGIWLPVKVSDRLIGILEFFKKDNEPEDKELLDCIYNIGLELGRHFEKLEAIDRIRQSEKSLIDAQHIAKLGSWKWDIANDEITWSDEMYQIYGLSKEDKDLTLEKCIGLIHPGDVNLTRKLLKESVENKRPLSYYYRITTPAGDLKILKAHGEIYCDEQGNVKGMFGTGHDVTEIRQAEEELRKTNIKLIETQRELVYNEKLAALGRFSSGIAHEIRNPLANISSLAQLVSKTDIDIKNKRRLNYIVTNVDIANKIIKNLLSYATPEDLDFNYKNITEILENILESIEARCRENNIKIVKEISNDLPVLYLDKLKLESSFMNFVSNSIDAMFDGGTLTVKADEDKQSNEVVIVFTDTGTGIPPENLDKILEPFFTTKDDGVGLGMGLAYQTIKLHHGEFKIESTEGIGTHIEIRLPVRKINLN